MVFHGSSCYEYHITMQPDKVSCALVNIFIALYCEKEDIWSPPPQGKHHTLRPKHPLSKSNHDL